MIEDNFYKNIRPKYEQLANVMLVKDVVPFELMKLRLLNGSHVSLSYCSDMLGYYFVHDAMSDPLIIKFVEDYLDEGNLI